MSNPQYSEFQYTLAPGGSVELHHYGQTFGCLDATAEFKVSFDGQPKSTFKKGLTYRDDAPFNSFRVENPNADPLEVTFFSALGDVRDARLVVPDDMTAFTGAARTLVASSFEIDSGERLEIVAANTSNIEVIVTNMGGAPVFLGDENVHWAKGLPLDAGSTATLKIQSALYAYAQAAGTQTLSILETRK